MPVDQLHVGPRAVTILRGCRTLTPETDGIAAMQGQRQHRFEPKVTRSVIDQIVDVGGALPAV